MEETEQSRMMGKVIKFGFILAHRNNDERIEQDVEEMSKNGLMNIVKFQQENHGFNLYFSDEPNSKRVLNVILDHLFKWHYSLDSIVSDDGFEQDLEDEGILGISIAEDYNDLADYSKQNHCCVFATFAIEVEEQWLANPKTKENE